LIVEVSLASPLLSAARAELIHGRGWEPMKIANEAHVFSSVHVVKNA
jgi:hypothetical protein